MSTRTTFDLLFVIFTINGCEWGAVTQRNEEQVVGLSSAQLAVECGNLADCQPYDVCIANGTVQCLNNACVARMQSGGDVKISCIVEIYKGLHEGTKDIPSSSTGGMSSISVAGSTSIPSTQCKCDCTGERANGIACTVCANLSQCQDQGGMGGAAPITVTTGGSTSTSSSLCGKVDPPPEDVAQMGERATCNRADGPGSVSGLAEVRSWVDITADRPGSTVKILSLSIFGVQSNGTSVAIGGTAIGNPVVTWSGHWLRTPWFPYPKDGGGKKSDATLLSNDTYAVPTNPYVLHLGNGSAPAGTYVDFFVVGVFQTTGDTKVSVGLDGYASSTAETPLREIGISDWYSCTTGSIEVVSYNSTLSNPCSNQKGTIVDASSSITPSNGCPSSGIQITAGPSLLATCPSGLQIVTWDNTGSIVNSPVGLPLTAMFDFQGFLHVTTMCNGICASTWPAAQTNALNAGYARVCSDGQDITNTSIICKDGDGNKLYVPLKPSEAGRCQ